MKRVSEITHGELAGFLATGRDFELVDVRDRDEVAGDSIAGSHCVPLTEISAFLNPLPVDRPIVFVCDVGKRSRQAASFAASVGYSDVSSLEGGIRAWKDREHEV